MLISAVITNNVTGYGPSDSRLIFDGDKRKYELWEVKFLGYLRLKKFSETILTPLAADASEEIRAADSMKNADAFVELIQYLDDRSLSLVIRDAPNDGPKALGILCEDYRVHQRRKHHESCWKVTLQTKERPYCLLWMWKSRTQNI